MTKAMVERLNGQRAAPPTTKALNFVCGALVAYDASRGESPYSGLDIERVFAAVELLARRRELEVTPFVSSWHPAVDEWDVPELQNEWDERFYEALASGTGAPLPAGVRPVFTETMRTVITGLILQVTRTAMAGSTTS
jgi:hypothetical protein